MKNHWLFKLIALVLALISGAMIAYCAFGMILSPEVGFPEGQLDAYNYSKIHNFCEEAAAFVTGTYAQQQSGASEEFFREYIFWNYPTAEALEHPFDYRLMDRDGWTLSNTRGSSFGYDYETHLETYVVHSTIVLMPELDYYPEYDEYTGYYAETDENGVTIEFPELTPGTYAYAYGYENGQRYRIDYTGTDYFTVEICLTDEAMQAVGGNRMEPGVVVEYFRTHAFRSYALGLSIGCVGLLLSVLWLWLTAGKGPYTDEICPAGLNRMPLDLYAVILAGGGFCLVIAAMWLVEQCLSITDTSYLAVWITGVAAVGMGCALLLAVGITALTAQIRVGNGYWQKNTLIGRCWGSICGLIRKIVRKILSWFGVAVSSMGGILPPVGVMLREVIQKMPLIWQWVLAYGGLFALTVWVASTFRRHGGVAFLVVAIFGFPVVLYTAYSFGKLRDAAKKMSQGRLDAKIDPQGEELHGCFREFAEDLNQLGDVCVAAAREQMKSERMRSELITNVSHDIKTPLTSIINYVDLLQKTDDEGERREYLEVLDRQSQRLKKLIEDLMEMSKASSGNLPVELTDTDVIEAVNQALGEFADRLEGQCLHLVRRMPGGPLMARCDGKFLWRVLSNVLANVVKYALPGTRVYVDVEELSTGWVQIRLRNISREVLDISAEELMERFVRGDESRNTEGNGLGLNIARSLMEAQGGTLELTVDGDLFKVVLTLPGV